MTISLVWILVVYALLVLLALVVFLVNIFHVIRFGSFDARNRFMGIALLLLVAAILVVAVMYLIGVDWSESLSLEIPSVSVPTIPSL